MKSFTKGVLITVVLSVTLSPVVAQEQPEEKQPGLIIPDDLTFDNQGFLVFEEQRVGGETRESDGSTRRRTTGNIQEQSR